MVCNLAGGTFSGGTGDDVGGDGNSSACLGDGLGFSAGTFNGGPGDDFVYLMTGWTFSGGSGSDSISIYCDGTKWSVENVLNTHCP